MIVNNILSGKEEAVDGYIEFLKCGSRKSPIESLKLAGVDMNRKMLAEMAVNDAEGFATLAELAKTKLA